MVHNMLTSLQNLDEIHWWENRPFSGVIPEPRQCKRSDIKKTIKKKAKRIRTAYTTEQVKALEHIFTQSKYITPERRQEISKTLNIGDKSVKIWFQNRRMKEKRESSESSCDSSRENITEEGSPAPIALIEFDHSYANDAHFGNERRSPELCQYQVPYFYEYAHNVSDRQIQNVYANNYNAIQDYGKQFYQDSNAYLTQYYPLNDKSYINENNCYPSQQDNPMYNTYSSSIDDVSNYFYN